MASGSSRRASRDSRDSLPLYNQTSYHGGLAEDFINVQPMPINEEKSGDFGQQYENSRRNSVNYMPPPFPPPGWQEDEEGATFWERHGRKIKFIVAFILMVSISAALLYPIFLYRETEDWTEEETPEISDRQLKFHTFLWLFISWTNLVFWWALASLMPYAFRFFAGFFNPGQAKYWHILRFMIPAVTMLGGAIGNYIGYVMVRFIWEGGSLFANSY